MCKIVSDERFSGYFSSRFGLVRKPVVRKELIRKLTTDVASIDVLKLRFERFGEYCKAGLVW